MTSLLKIEEKLKSLSEIKELTPVEAFSKANEIVEAINKIAEEQVEKKNYGTLEKLYEKAAEAYLLAAEKVPRESRDSVAFPANYWEMRARQVGLELGLELIEPPTRISKPFSKSEIGISKPIHEIGSLYPKKEGYRDVQHSFMKAISEKFAEKPESTKAKFYRYGGLAQSKKIENELKVESFKTNPTILLPSPEIVPKKIYEPKIEPLKASLFRIPRAPKIEHKDVAKYAARSIPLEVKSNIKPLPKPPLKDIIYT